MRSPINYAYTESHPGSKFTFSGEPKFPLPKVAGSAMSSLSAPSTLDVISPPYPDLLQPKTILQRHG